MKFAAALLVLATSALANNIRRGGDEYESPDYESGKDYETGENEYGQDEGYGEKGGYKHEVKEVAVTYTTTTVCPVTYTHYKEGTTYCETKLITSTLVVAETKTVDVTVKEPDVTKHYTDVNYVTRTTVCPVTQTKTVAGEVITEVYTTTSVIYDVVKSTDYEHQPDVTKFETDVVYHTKTNVYPVTVTNTIAGEVITKVYTSTEYVVEKVHTTVYNQVKKPDVTKHETDVVYHTKYEVYPVTVTKTVEGEVITNVITSTSVIVEKVATTVPAVETIVKTIGKGEVVTQYSKVYHTVGGGTVYETVAPQPTTVQAPETEVVTQPEVTVPATPTIAPKPVATGAAAAKKAPVFAFMAGILGAVALI
ncbi:uncharacterized protein FRV6_07282 [Fusarium oxysporum]|uniref:Repetitive proline-rich cell wall protein n=1 Tax=Fusarium oxysporum TaxID=5507 RepID=A0A2H3T680_FUSOX|nr:uncharacterized protein FRV6_07282 [Fusarium oxysporum]